MWWLWENVPHPNLEGTYSAQGAWGQSITVYPEMEVVLAYKTNSIYRRANDNARLNELVVKVARMYDAEKGDLKGKICGSFHDKAVEEAIVDFHETRKGNPDMDLEDFLNTPGYEFLVNEDYEKALAVF